MTLIYSSTIYRGTEIQKNSLHIGSTHQLSEPLRWKRVVTFEDLLNLLTSCT